MLYAYIITPSFHKNSEGNKMDQFIPQILGLITLLGVLTIVAVIVIAIFRPAQLSTIANLIRAIVFALLGRDMEVQVKTKRKRKNSDDHLEN